jgi:hypothetical protein
VQASSTATDTAWILTLQDIHADGTAVNVTAGWLRAGLRTVDDAAIQDHRVSVPCHKRATFDSWDHQTIFDQMEML